MDEIWRVLKDEGTVWVNLGDTYGGGKSGQGGDCGKHTIENPEINGTRFELGVKKPLNKSLLLIPHRFAIGCIDRGWIIRNDCVWAKRNGMPESVTDRFSKKHEYFFFMVKQEKYYFDLDSVRDKHKQVSIDRSYRGVSEDNKWVNGADGQTPHNLSQPRKKTTKIDVTQAEIIGSPRARQHREGYEHNPDLLNPLGKNPGSVSDFWDIPTKPSSKKHYATYSDELIKKPILAGCPEGGTILDPFAGTCTTGLTALRANRNFIGIEASKEYWEIGNKAINDYVSQQTINFE